MKIKSILLKIVWYSELGRGKVLARGWGLIPEALMLFTFLKVYGIQFSTLNIILIIIGIYVVSILLGRWYARTGFLQIENSLNNQYNNEIQAILKK